MSLLSPDEVTIEPRLGQFWVAKRKLTLCVIYSLGENTVGVLPWGAEEDKVEIYLEPYHGSLVWLWYSTHIDRKRFLHHGWDPKTGDVGIYGDLLFFIGPDEKGDMIHVMSDWSCKRSLDKSWNADDGWALEDDPMRLFLPINPESPFTNGDPEFRKNLLENPIV